MQDLNKVTVEVPRSANKTAIKDAFEAVFGVEVVDVRTSIVNSKPKDAVVAMTAAQIS